MDKLAQAKDHFETALACQERGDFVQAEGLYRKALDLAPDRPSVLVNLAAVLLKMGRPAEARPISERALEIDPRNPAALLNLGISHLKTGNAGAALARLDAALKIKPDYVEALVNRGGALRELDRLDEALECYGRAQALKPDCFEALTAQAAAMRRLKRYDEALSLWDQALVWQPGSAEAVAGRSHALLDLNRLDEALVWCRKALEVQPGDALALTNIGTVLYRLNEHEKALEAVDAALSIRSDLVEAHFVRGAILSDLGRHEEAVASYEMALASRPDLGYGLGALVHSRMHCCDWRSLGLDLERLSAAVGAGRRGVDPFHYLSITGSAKEQLSCSHIWVRDKFPASEGRAWKEKRYSHDKIRLAYVSGDFGNHPVSLLMAGVFELHDRAKFETTAISFGRDDGSNMRARLKGAFDRFIDVRQNGDRETSRLIRDLEIDIAVDLSGFTKSARTNIFALRPAPIQINYLGYPGTLGAEYFDYILADRFVIPEEYSKFYSENVARLPDCFQANDFRREAAARTPSRGEMGLPDPGFVFCCANNSYKITPAMFDVWMRILRGVSESCLWLVSGRPYVDSNLRKEAKARGIDPQRLVFARPALYAQYLARYRAADLFLDTFPFNGGTTASDALWAGLPVLTCSGESFAARMAGSLLRTVGLQELIAGSMEEYEALALLLAREPERLAGIKQSLVSARDTSALFDTDRFRRNLEKAYTAMWRRHQDGVSPSSFDVEGL